MNYITCKKCKKLLFISLVFLLLIFSSKYNFVVWADNIVTVIQQPTVYSCGDGEKAVYSIKASGSGNSYQWQYSMDNGKTWKNSGDAGNKTETLTFTARKDFNGLLLRCVVTNGSTTIISDSAKLNVTEKVAVTQQPTAYSCSDGEKAVYSIKASGSGNSYQWQYSMDNGKTWKNSGDAGNKTETLTFTARKDFNGLLLRCVVTNGSTTIISDSAKLNVTEKVAVTQQPTAYSCSDGEKAVYSIKASGSGNSYQWQYSMDNGKTWKNSGDAGNKTETLTFIARKNFNGLLLRCVVKNGSLSITSNPAKLNIINKEEWELPIQ